MTAAISAGSTRLSAACWRMMSSWRSGSLISSTAWLTGCTRLSTATITAARPVARTSRRRRTLRRRARVRGALSEEVRALAGWALMGSGGQLRKYPRQLLLEFPQRAGVFYSVGGALGLLGLGELARGALVDGFVPAGGRPLGPHGLVGHHGDRGVVARLQAGLEQQRRLYHERARRRLAGGLAPPPPRAPPPPPWPGHGPPPTRGRRRWRTPRGPRRSGRPARPAPRRRRSG